MFSEVACFFNWEVFNLRNLSNKIYLLLDCLFVNVAICIGLIIKFDGDVPVVFIRMLPLTCVFTTVASLTVFFLFDIYSMLWTYASVEELIEGYIEQGERLFKPDNNISRSEAVTIVNKMLFRGPLSGIEIPFKDVAETHWAYGHILESALDHNFKRNEDDSETAILKD
jgi:hypothetical protein